MGLPSRHAKRYLFALFALWIVLTLIPLPPPTLATGLDPSWAYGLNMAHAQHLVFGRDVVFTFGPLGYLFYPIPRFAEASAAFVLPWAVYVVFLLGLFLIYRSLGRSFFTLLSCFVLTIAMVLMELPFERMQLAFLALAVGVLARTQADREHTPWIYLMLAGTLAGVLPLFKINEGIASLIVFYALLLTQSSRTSWTRLALLPPVSFVLAFLLVEHDLAGLPAYVVRSIQVAMGYSEAMASPGPSGPVILAIVSLVALFGVIPLLAGSRRRLLPGLVPALAASFFAFKSAFVRQDDAHVTLLQIKLCIAALFLLVCAQTLRDRVIVSACVMAAFFLGFVIYFRTYPSAEPGFRNRVILVDSWSNFSDYLHFTATWNRNDAITQRTLQPLEFANPQIISTAGKGTVDDVPYSIDIILANGWKWEPRPVFQSYSAYTPVLDSLNAGHLAQPGSADHILLQWQDIDERQPLLDDAASWRSLFDHYDIAIVRSDGILLNRRSKPRYADPTPIGDIATRWNTDIALPLPENSAGAVIMMRAEIPKSAWGILRGLVFRNSSTYVTATHKSGRHSRWRVTRPNLINGAFVSWLPESLGETLAYFGDSSRPDDVQSIRFETPGELEFSSSIRISWYAVRFQPGEQRSLRPEDGQVSETHLETSIRPLNIRGKGYIDSIDSRPPTETVTADANQPITISGWAVDEKAHRPASAVYIDVDGHLFATSYGSARPDVAAAFSQPAYTNSGFTGRFSAGPGTHHVAVRIVDVAGRGYYTAPAFQLYLR